MEDKRRKEWPAVAIALSALVLVLPGLYLCGYFCLAKVEEGYWMPEGIPVVYRTYGAKWLARAFEPAGKFEASVTTHEVEIGP